MIDIHPPQHGSITRRDFFIHLGIVVLGILIAIGLEQSVEYFHHMHQAAELRSGAIMDARIYLRDVDQNRAANTRQIEDLSARIQQVRDAIAQHHPLPPPFYRPEMAVNTIRLANLSAAKTSGIINLLSKDEITSAGDAEVAVTKSETLKQRAQEAATKRIAFEQRFQTQYPSGPFDFSRIAPSQLDEYLGLLLDERVRRAETLAYFDEMHRGVEAYLSGRHDLQQIQDAEEGQPVH